ncbi:TIGR00730 family Rossman fold protein [candidate division KSB1 bacterium]|nr:MAG: TIGR00730 family Rossman fold protein [candidate division KSB1 bacterium]
MFAESVRRVQEDLKKASPEEAVRIRQKITIDERMSKYYADCMRLTGLLTDYFRGLPDPRSHHVVCSGGGPGIMEAANRGAIEAGGKTVGFSISLPHEQANNRFLDPRLTFEFHYFFMRKYWFMYLARGLVVFPGGFGTMDELFEMMTLVQTQKVRKRVPIVLYGSAFWEDVVRFETMVQWGVISPEDTKLFKICDTPEEALEFLKKEIDGGLDMEPNPAHDE